MHGVVCMVGDGGDGWHNSTRIDWEEKHSLPLLLDICNILKYIFNYCECVIVCVRALIDHRIVVIVEDIISERI